MAPAENSCNFFGSCLWSEAMTKTQALKIFGGRQEAAAALGYTPEALRVWPHRLRQRQVDLVVGAAYRLGLMSRLPDRVARDR